MAQNVNVTMPEYAQEVYKKTKCLPLDFTELTAEFRQKAKEELGEESEDMVKNSLKDLRKLMTEVEENWTPNPDDEYMIRFLRAKKYDLKRTCALVKNHYLYQLRYTNIFDTLGEDVLQKGLDDTLQVVLPYRTPSGCPIWVWKLGRWDPDTFSFQQMVQLGAVCIEKIIEYPITQVCGTTCLWDMKGVGWKHIFQLTPPNLSCFFGGLQECYPMRLKEIHIVNGFRIFQPMFYLMKPFMSAKMRNRVFIHGSDMSSLHKHIPPEILPSEYGGHLGPYQDYGLFDLMRKSEESMLKCLNYGYHARIKRHENVL